MSPLTTFIQLSFGSPIQIHQAIKRNSRYPNLKGRGKTDTICRLKSESVSHSVVSDSSQPQGLQPDRLLCPLGFSRQEYWSGLPFLPPGDFPDPGTEPGSLALQTDFLPSESWGKKSPYMILYVENTKDFSKNMRTNTLSKVAEEKSVYKNHMHFFTLTTNCYKRNWENNSIYICMKMNKMSRNKFNQGGERHVHWKLKTHWWKILKMTQINGKIFCAHELEDLILLICPYYPKQSTDSLQSLSKFQWKFSQIQKKQS